MRGSSFRRGTGGPGKGSSPLPGLWFRVTEALRTATAKEWPRRTVALERSKTAVRVIRVWAIAVRVIWVRAILICWCRWIIGWETHRSAVIGLAGGLCADATSGSPPPPAPSPPPAQAQAPVVEPAAADHIVNIGRARCEDLLKLSPEDRAAASMFYIGYQASRLRTSTIDVGVIPSIEGRAIAYCEENPERTVAAAFASAYLQNRRR